MSDFHDDETDPPQLISRVNCTGSESKLLDCPYTMMENNGGDVFLNDVHITCHPRMLIFAEIVYV